MYNFLTETKTKQNMTKINDLFELCMTIPEFAAVVKPALFLPHPLVALLEKNVRPNAMCSINQHFPSWNRFLGTLHKFHPIPPFIVALVARIQDGVYKDHDIEYFDSRMNLYKLNRGRHNTEISKIMKTCLVRQFKGSLSMRLLLHHEQRRNILVRNDWERSGFALLDKYGNYFKYIEATTP